MCKTNCSHTQPIKPHQESGDLQLDMQNKITVLSDALLYLMRESVANGMVTAEPAIVQAKAALKLIGRKGF